MCTRPKDMWFVAAPGTPSGRRLVSKPPPDGGAPLPMKCGRCIECRQRYAYEWQVRLTHELRDHRASCFINLTYDDEHLPGNASLRPEDVRNFLKRLRKRIGSFRYFYVGEYGDLRGRPHYHMILYGYDFREDAKQCGVGKYGDALYSSETLTKAWSIDGKPIGLCNFGSVTSQSIGYVCGYALKKQYGAKAKRHYEYSDDAGEVHDRLPEFVRMSRRPGIGRRFFDRFEGEMFDNDSVILKGRERPIPVYYEKLFKAKSLDHAQRLEDMKLAREARAIERAELEQRSLLRIEQIEAFEAAVQKRFRREFD